MAGDLDLLLGTWTVRVKSWSWEYNFQPGGIVTWRDLGSIENGLGNWAATSKLVNIWWKGSTSRESWIRPLTVSSDRTWYESTYYKGKYKIEKTGAISPAPSPPPPQSPSNDAAAMDRAWEASRASLRYVFTRLRALDRQIQVFERLGGNEASFNELRAFRRDIAVISRKMVVPLNALDPAFREALTKVMRLVEQNLALPKSLKAARDGGMCAGHPRTFAFTRGRVIPSDTDLCTLWFNSNPELQRDVITHEYFHTLGLEDISVSNTAEALRNANTVAQVVAHINDRYRQKNSDGFEPAVPPYPSP